jgi:hypothetical protein
MVKKAHGGDGPAFALNHPPFSMAGGERVKDTYTQSDPTYRYLPLNSFRCKKNSEFRSQNSRSVGLSGITCQQKKRQNLILF